MPLVDVLRSNMTTGEVSPLMVARPDVDRVRNGLGQCENFIVLSQGGVMRRHGMRYVATANHTGALALVRAFEPSTTEAYILEIGQGYIGFYLNGARIESAPGVPLTVATPYQADELRLLRTAQSNDVMILVHPNHAPRRLSRLSSTSWDLRPITFRPPPLFEAGIALAADLALSAVSGIITAGSSLPIFLPADVQRQIVSGLGRAVITSVLTPTSVEALVIEPFLSTTLGSGTWTLAGSPVGDLTPDIAGPVGALVTLTLAGVQSTAPNLVANGDFASGDLTSWSNFSAPTLATGTHTGSNNNTTLVDSTADFLAAGVQPTHLVHNITDDSRGLVATVTPLSIIFSTPGLTGGAENDFDTGDAYTVQQTGAASVSGQTALLRGGTAGVGWIEQAVTTVVGQRYQWTFTVSDAPLAAMVGSTSQMSDVLAEASYPVGTHTVSFVATSTSSYLQFRQNQNVTAKVGAIALRLASLTGFRVGDGAYVRLNGGVVVVTAQVDSSTLRGEILKELTSTDPAAAGAWSMESPVWSDMLGWPSAVVLYEGRLFFAGSSRFPQTIWGSVIEDFFNFALGPNDDDAVQFGLVDSGGNITLNRIRWLMPAENMLVGTTHGEYRLIGSGDDPLTPRTPPRVRVQSTFGSDAVQPLKVGAALLFAQRQGSKMREMAFDDRTTTTFVARDITVLSSHLLADARLVEVAYQQEPLSIVWGVRSDGVLLGLTYDLSEQVVGWHRHTTQGQVLSVATIPDPAANAHQVWVSVRRGTQTMIERLDPQAVMQLPTPVVDPGTGRLIASWAGLTLDSAVVWTAGGSTITGLDHLNGQVVQVVADGAVLAERTVYAGQITLEQPVATVAFVGLGFQARGQTLPPEVPLRGTSQGSRKRWALVTLRLFQSLGLVVNGEALTFRTPGMPQDQGVPPYTGDKIVHPLGWSTAAPLTFVCADPLPCTVLGLIGVLDIAAEAQESQASQPTAPQSGSRGRAA